MMELARSLAWFFVVSCAVAYAVFLFGGSAILREAEADVHTVLVRDEITPGAHHLSGMVMVPRTCMQLIVETARVAEFTYEFLFRTWEEPSIDCADELVPRRFHTVVFAPGAGIDFVASLDGEPIPVVVYPVLPRDAS